MDTSTIQTRPDLVLNTTSPQRTKNLENTESTNETRSDSDQDNSPKVAQETVNFSDTSIKLSASSPVKNSDQAPMIENQAQAQQVLNQLMANLQSNPAQAQAAHGKIFDSAVKSLLG